jgi:very-short-patch-repair endonuclease
VLLIVEVDSVEHHGFGSGPELTARRRAALTAEGWTVVPVSPLRLRDDADGFRAELEQTYLRLARAGSAGEGVGALSVVTTRQGDGVLSPAD